MIMFSRVVFAYGISAFTSALVKPGDQWLASVVGIILILAGSYGMGTDSK